MLVNLASYRGKAVVDRSTYCSLDVCISLLEEEKNEKEKKRRVFSKVLIPNQRTYTIFRLIRLLRSGNFPVSEFPSNHLRKQ